MSDDLERRLRGAFQDAALPEAPGTLRHALADLPDREPAGQPDGRRRRWPVLALAATAAVIAIAVGVLSFGGPLPGPATTPSASSSAEGLPEPPATVPLLDRPALEAAIRAQRAGSLEPQVVVTSVGVNPSIRLGPVDRECDPVLPCTVVGTLDDIDADLGTVAVTTEERVQPIPLEAADLRGPLALRLSASGPVQLLGHVDLPGGDGGKVDVARLLDLTATTPDGRVVAADGWLAGVNAPSCGPAFLTPPPAPFDCPGLRAFLTDEPVRPATPEGENGTRISVPPTAVQVQFGAYQQFAQAPVSPGVGGNDEPRRGLYLVRMVVADVDGCPACRGWLMVGRLDAEPIAAPAASPGDAPPDQVVIQSPGELADVLARNRASLVGTAVFVDGRVISNARGCPLGVTTCNLWSLAGTDEQVTMSDLTAAQLASDAPFMLEGRLALRVLPDSLEYLGWLGSFGADGGITTDVASLVDLASMPRGPVTAAVDGWLVAGMPTPCPRQPGMDGLDDTAFVTCPPAWLMRDDVQPTLVTDGSVTYEEPSPAIHVQYGAYGEYAPAPQADAGVPLPQHGTYLVRLLRNPNVADPETARSWQVIGRLDPPLEPAPAGQPVPVDATPAPSATAPAAPEPTAPADLPRTASVEQDGIRLDLRLAHNPMPAGEVAMMIASVTNTGSTPLHWVSDSCETLVAIEGTVTGVPWRMGVTHDGVAQTFKRYALGTFSNIEPPAPEVIEFRQVDAEGHAPEVCNFVAIDHTLGPGETVRATSAWDGLAARRLGLPAAGPMTITGTFGEYTREPLTTTTGPGAGSTVGVQLPAWITGGADASLLSPPEVVDRVLTDPVFLAYLDTIEIGNGNAPFARYRPEDGEWDVGVLRYAGTGNTLRYVRVDPSSGAILGSEDRAWDRERDGTP
jgi:hypothetical protein